MQHVIIWYKDGSMITIDHVKQIEITENLLCYIEGSLQPWRDSMSSIHKIDVTS